MNFREWLQLREDNYRDGEWSFTNYHRPVQKVPAGLLPGNLDRLTAPIRANIGYANQSMFAKAAQEIGLNPSSPFEPYHAGPDIEDHMSFDVTVPAEEIERGEEFRKKLGQKVLDDEGVRSKLHMQYPVVANIEKLKTFTPGKVTYRITVVDGTR